ncbi:MAG: hypothetical protein ACPGVO_07375 [Spirulinaceae cyanobacterium]
MAADLLANIYNAFEPNPLQPGDLPYVDCQAARAQQDVATDLGRVIRRSQTLTQQLYTGYRGSGKTTELYQLKRSLEEDGYQVIYWTVEEAMTRHAATFLLALFNVLAAPQDPVFEPGQRVLIVDNLDRIQAPLRADCCRNNYEVLFLDHAPQLKALNYHVIYTIPPALVYSRHATDLKDLYGSPNILLSVMAHQPNGIAHSCGLQCLKDILRSRLPQDLPIRWVAKARQSTHQIPLFESEDVLNRLGLMSGGQIRDLLHLMQWAINKTDELPLQAEAIERAIAMLRDIYW